MPPASGSVAPGQFNEGDPRYEIRSINTNTLGLLDSIPRRFPTPLENFDLMDKWDWQRMDHTSHEAKQYLKMGHSRRHDHHRSRHPSFSSALLDAICKSTEDEQGEGINCSPKNNNVARNTSCKRAARMERETPGKQEEDQWMADAAAVKPTRRRSAEIGVFDAEKYFAGQEVESLGRSMAAAGAGVGAGAASEEDHNSNKQRTFQLLIQSISSAGSCTSETSDNTSNWPYSSSDAESLHRPTGKYSTKTARHSEKGRKWASCMARGREWSEDLSSCAKDGGFRSEPFVPESKSKSKVRKDSKHPKQPISPGSKLASFLNSLFMASGTKKAKLSSSSSLSESNSYYSSSQRKPASSACSSSSSVHRSCMSKTTGSSRGKTSNGVRRSVTFYPTSIVVDECSRPCGHMENPTPIPNPAHSDAYKKLKLHLLDKGSQASTAKGIIAKYHKANSILEAVARELDNQDEEEDDDDDDASCSSSDLFELENLAAADISLYHKELPVYETTHLETNKAIAKGLIV